MLAGVLRSNKRDFSSLNAREILSLAIAAEEEDGRIYATYAEKLRAHYPGTAAIFDGMAEEEDGHRRRLLDLYVEKFGKQRDDDSKYNKDDQHGRFPGLTDVGMTSGVDGLNYSEPV